MGHQLADGAGFWCPKLVEVVEEEEDEDEETEMVPHQLAEKAAVT